MKNIFTTLFILLIASGVAFSQAQKSIVKSISTADASGVILELPGKVTVQEWEKDFLRIVVTINAKNTSEDILKRLISVGRYDIESEVIGDKVHITMPKMAHTITIKGTDLEDQLHFEVSYPKNSILQIILPKFYVPAQAL